ncbi:ABC transporter permease [Falseniella ignava]|uniref:ABC transporter permease n=1 Tax=Falseniella ignava CCUG 37419 TaxID=883112 RepID=K1LGN9_9LACT|nr:ABC transporter permease [Falseniella ignava]EKB55795.1 hypothetical protein HMPREF9707_00982 [Falseniella ignava CCUG 37419]
MNKGKYNNHISRLILILIGILLLAFIIKGDSFYKTTNFISMQRQMVEYGLMALGVSVAMISGGIDLSTVYIANLSAIIAGLIMMNYSGITGIVLAVVCAIGIGVICGTLNGVLVSKINIPPMLATLGTMQLFMGIAIIITAGRGLSGVSDIFPVISKVTLFNFIPLSFVIYLFLVALIAYIFDRTTFGLKVYSVGTNSLASRYTGYNVSKILIKTYLISGILSSVAGLISLSRINSAKADFGSSYTMQTILIAVLGGLNPNGGSGKILGVFLATIIVQVLSSLLNLFPNINNFYRDLIWGGALIFVLLLNYYVDNKKRRSS